MGSRESILNKIKTFQNKSTLEIIDHSSKNENLIGDFIENAKLAGAIVYENLEEQKELIKEIALKDDYFIYESSLGVAENGALWCNNLEDDRKYLFLSNYLIIKIKKSNILQNMHQAYEKIIFERGEFGTFIAGPSKTADIEQSLVLGAHGAMRLYIFLND